MRLATDVNVQPRLLREHWLALVNVLAALFVVLPFAAPVLLAAGWERAAGAIYVAYRAVCHQWAFRSYFLFGPSPTYRFDELQSQVGPERVFGFLGSPEVGFKVAFCERDVAIYLAVVAAGLAFAALRPHVSALPLVWYGVMIAPMAVDGFTQLFGWRESTVELRTLTGALFGLASVWLLYPRIDVAIRSAGSNTMPSAASATATP